MVLYVSKHSPIGSFLYPGFMQKTTQELGFWMCRSIVWHSHPTPNVQTSFHQTEVHKSKIISFQHQKWVSFVINIFSNKGDSWHFCDYVSNIFPKIISYVLIFIERFFQLSLESVCEFLSLCRDFVPIHNVIFCLDVKVCHRQRVRDRRHVSSCFLFYMHAPPHSSYRLRGSVDVHGKRVVVLHVVPQEI